DAPVVAGRRAVRAAQSNLSLRQPYSHQPANRGTDRKASAQKRSTLLIPYSRLSATADLPILSTHGVPATLGVLPGGGRGTRALSRRRRGQRREHPGQLVLDVP